MTDQNLGSATAKPGAFDTIVLGGLLAGTLDAMDGVVAFGFNGMNPIQVLQYIASGLLAPSSWTEKTKRKPACQTCQLRAS